MRGMTTHQLSKKELIEAIEYAFSDMDSNHETVAVVTEIENELGHVQQTITFARPLEV